MPTNVLFRADASLEIGTGHVMRCLALADALRGRGATCRFACREHPGNLVESIRERGHQAHALPLPPRPTDPTRGDAALPPPHAAWLGTDWETDARLAQALTHDKPVDWLVVDHYTLDARWERALRPHAARVLVIDDLADRSHDCDLLLDQNLGHDAADYAALVPPACRLLVGPSHALLRPEFAALRTRGLARRSPPRLGRVLVSLGGVDKDNLTLRVLDALQASHLAPDCRITVVMGAHAPGLGAVRARAETMPWTTEVLVDVRDMAALMADSDLAIGAAGSTTWERCCLGLPSLMVVAAPNQAGIAQAMHASGAALSLGEADRPGFAHAMARAIDQLARDPGALHSMSEKARGLTAGDGTGLVADAMLSLHPAREPAVPWTPSP